MQSRKVAADTTKGGRAILTAEGARNLLLNFDHPEISFRLVVCKRHAQVMEKGEDLITVGVERFQQVACGRLLRARLAGHWALACAKRSQKARSQMACASIRIGPVRRQASVA